MRIPPQIASVRKGLKSSRLKAEEITCRMTAPGPARRPCRSRHRVDAAEHRGQDGDEQVALAVGGVGRVEARQHDERGDRRRAGSTARRRFMMTRRVSNAGKARRLARSSRSCRSRCRTGVRFSITASGTAQRAKTRIANGTPNTVPLPMKTIGSGKPEMTLPRVRPMERPLTRVMVPSVARIGDTPR